MTFTWPRRWQAAPLAAWALGFAAPTMAADSARLAELLAGMSSFQANFEQVVMNQFGEPLQTTTGTLHWQRPHRLRWETDEPYPQLVLADGESLWVFDPDLEQVSVQPLAGSIDGTPAVFLAGTADDLATHFDVRADEAAEGQLRFVLTPHDEASVFHHMTLAFSAQNALAGLDIVDHLDQRTSTTFHDARKNPSLPPRLFTFEVPEGADLIGELPPTPAGSADSP